MTDAWFQAELRALDDASLVVALVERVRPRYRAGGLDSLHPPERALLAVFELDNEVCNGGFEQWLFHTAGDLAGATPACLLEIGAPEAAAVVRRVLAEFGEEGPAVDYWRREDQLFGLPASAGVAFRQCDQEFAKLESPMLQRLYAFARSHLPEIEPR